MYRIGLPLLRLSVIFLAFASGSSSAGEENRAAPKFEKDVRQIFKTHCFSCHGEGDELEGGLDLRLRRLMVKGGESGPAITPGEPGKSLLLERLRDGEMPPDDKNPLTAAQIAVISRWIDTGAKTVRPEPKEIGGGLQITAEDREYWAFQPIRRPAVPTVKHMDRVRTPIDAFLLARLQANEASYSADAEKPALIRRAHFDLLGLPPTPAAVELFLSDDSPDAWARLIDRLLDSPHYGERWGRHWLDVAGYADSEGYTNDDSERKWAWKYRDYVIRSFNDDKPLDEFIREQLAGDEMVAPPYKDLKPADAEKLVATGFLRMAPDGTATGGVDQTQARNQVMADTINIVSSSLLGLTVGCAQCHHHRYDPIPQTDYYRLRAIFEPAYDWKNWRTPPARLISLYTDANRQQAREIESKAKQIDQQRLKQQAKFIERTYERELAKLPEQIRETVRKAHDTTKKKRTAEQTALLKKYPSVNVTAGSLYLYDRKAADELKKFSADAKKIRATKPKEEFIRSLTEVPGKVPKTFLFDRGEPRQPKQELAPAALTVLSPPGADSSAVIPASDPKLPTTGRRLAYARRLTDGTHPLLARVLVNRIWMHHFGRGIVETPGDFGTLGTRPTHPLLLDWLAMELMDGGWSAKRLHRLMMTSTVYRQSSRRDRRLHGIDPDNHLYGSMPLRRLEAESIRDAILSISGKLNPKAFGPPVPVMADRIGQFVIGIENLNAGRPGAVIAMQGEEFRRSVYVQVRRSRPLAVLDTFDMPAMNPNCNVRATSTVAPQALMLMNNAFVVTQSESFADRVRREAGDSPDKQIHRAWMLAFSRQPTEEELQEAAAFLSAQTQDFQAKSKAGKKAKSPPNTNPQMQALASFCQTLLGSNEFLYVD
jgi:hypothetical protein